MHYISNLNFDTPSCYPQISFFQQGISNLKHHLPENLEAYNIVAREMLAGSGIAVWDSTIPLSQAYVAEVSDYTSEKLCIFT